MKSRVSLLTDFLAVSALALAIPAVSAPTRDLPAAHRAGEVTYISGGVSQPEADAIKHVATYYPLEIQFLRKAKPKDEYLTGVRVRIKDEHHMMVLNVTSDGPFLLAKLPAGKYTVSAERNRDLKTREVEIVATEHRRLVFEWQS